MENWTVCHNITNPMSFPYHWMEKYFSNASQNPQVILIIVWPENWYTIVYNYNLHCYEVPSVCKTTVHISCFLSALAVISTVHCSATSLKPATAEVNNINRLTTMECSSGTHLILAFKWRPADTNHPPQTL